jgi:hypothetical protein
MFEMMGKRRQQEKAAREGKEINNEKPYGRSKRARRELCQLAMSNKERLEESCSKHRLTPREA